MASTPRTIAGMPLVATLCAGAATYPLITLVTLRWSGFTIPGVDEQLALAGYAAVVLTFMGAVYWGLAMSLPPPVDEPRFGALRDWRAYTASMAPGLAAWIALQLPTRGGAWLLIAAYALLALYDRHCAVQGEIPFWLARMRLSVVATAIACVVFGILI